MNEELVTVLLDAGPNRGHHRRMELLERDNALALLDEYALDAAGGDSRVVLIAGEAGVGKTALIEELQHRRPDDRWLWGACDGSFTPQPLAPLLDVADQLGGDLAKACRSDDLPRGTVFRLLRDELIASDELTVLVFEDVHWADEASLDLIQFLSRRVRDCRVLILTTYRDDALGRDHPLHLFLVVPQANWGQGGRAREKPVPRVAHRLAAFFGDERRELDVVSAHIFGYGQLVGPVSP